jgi:hypothetical protein
MDPEVTFNNSVQGVVKMMQGKKTKMAAGGGMMKKATLLVVLCPWS